ncbi:unnamed protein product, partial [Phaeothamnion confervicola]
APRRRITPSLLARRWHWDGGRVRDWTVDNKGGDVQEGEGGASIDEENFLQPEWRSLDRRLRNRRTREVGEGPRGRSNLKKSEEDFWLEAGLYVPHPARPGLPDNEWSEKAGN